jgi:TonB family protein
MIKRMTMTRAAALSFLLHSALLLAGWSAVKSSWGEVKSRRWATPLVEVVISPESPPATPAASLTHPEANRAGSALVEKRPASSVVKKRTGGETVAGHPVSGGNGEVTIEGGAASPSAVGGALAAGSGGPATSSGPVAAGQPGGSPAGTGAGSTVGPSQKQIESRIWSLVNEAAQYPAPAKRAGIEGVVDLSFRITAQGRALDIQVVRSSGFSVLDSAAVEAVQDAGPYPLTDKRVVIPIRFSLK